MLFIIVLHTGKGYFLIPFISILLVISIYIWYAPLHYIIEKEKLIVVFGFSKKKYNILKFISIKKSDNPISSPARSLKRVAIQSLESGIILISPKDRDKFIEEIQRINPNLK